MHSIRGTRWAIGVAEDQSAVGSRQLGATALGGGRFLVSDGTHQHVAYAVVAGSVRWVFLNGHTYVVGSGQSAVGSKERPARRDDDLALAAPMPASVSSVNVAVGQQVARGDVLIMLEAMKMELPIKAPRDGRVTTIACRQGELVQPGIPLLELE